MSVQKRRPEWSPNRSNRREGINVLAPISRHAHSAIPVRCSRRNETNSWNSSPADRITLVSARVALRAREIEFSRLVANRHRACPARLPDGELPRRATGS
jgi:hypothetical protein